MIDNRACLVVTYILNEKLKFVSGAYFCVVSMYVESTYNK